MKNFFEILNRIRAEQDNEKLRRLCTENFQEWRSTFSVRNMAVLEQCVVSTICQNDQREALNSRIKWSIKTPIRADMRRF
jgi:hypothetical protein